MNPARLIVFSSCDAECVEVGENSTVLRGCSAHERVLAIEGKVALILFALRVNSPRTPAELSGS